MINFFIAYEYLLFTSNNSKFTKNKKKFTKHFVNFVNDNIF